MRYHMQLPALPTIQSMLGMWQHTLELRLPFEVVATVRNFPQGEACHFYGKDSKGERRNIIGRRVGDEYFTLSIMGETEYIREDDTTRCYIKDYFCLSEQKQPVAMVTNMENQEVVPTATTPTDTPMNTTTSSIYPTPQSAELNSSKTSQNSRKSSRIQNKYGEGHSLVKKLKLAPSSRNVEEPRSTEPDVVAEGCVQSSSQESQLNEVTDVLSADTMETLEAILALNSEGFGSPFPSPLKYAATEAFVALPVEQTNRADFDPLSHSQEILSHQGKDSKDCSDSDGFLDDQDQDPDWVVEETSVLKTPPRGRKRSTYKSGHSSCALSKPSNNSPFTISVSQLLEGAQHGHLDLDYTNPPSQPESLIDTSMLPEDYIPPKPGETPRQWMARNPNFIYYCLICNKYQTKQRSTFKSHLHLVHKTSITEYRKKKRLALDLHSPYIEKKPERKSRKKSQDKKSDKIKQKKPQDKNVDGNSTMLCELCGSPFGDQWTLEMHLKSIHSSDPRSEDCLVALSHQAWGLVRKNFICPYCPSVFEGAEVLTHLADDHSQAVDFVKTVRGIRQLLTTEQKCQERVLKKREEKRESNPPPASVGDTSAINWRKAYGHYRPGCSADGVSHYGCVHCTVVMQDLTKLKRHIAESHQNHRKFMCDECASSYNTSIALEQHVRSRHCGRKCRSKFSKLERTCPDCGKVFLLPSLMMEHFLTHDAEESDMDIPSIKPKSNRKPKVPSDAQTTPENERPNPEVDVQDLSETDSAASVEFIVESSRDKEGMLVDLTDEPSRTNASDAVENSNVNVDTPEDGMDFPESPLPSPLHKESPTRDKIDSPNHHNDIRMENPPMENSMDSSIKEDTPKEQVMDSSIKEDTPMEQVMESSNKENTPMEPVMDPSDTLSAAKEESPIRKMDSSNSRSLVGGESHTESSMDFSSNSALTKRATLTVNIDTDVKNDDATSESERGVSTKQGMDPPMSQSSGERSPLHLPENCCQDTVAVVTDTAKNCMDIQYSVQGNQDPILESRDSHCAILNSTGISVPRQLLDHVGYIKIPSTP